MDEFYLHLPSNTHTNSEENTINRYINTFSDTIDLGRDWEVGLTDISYTYSWYNVKGGCQIIIKSFNGDGKKTRNLYEMYNVSAASVDTALFLPIELGFPRVSYRKQPDGFKPHERTEIDFYLAPGNYASIQALVNQINKQVRNKYKLVYGEEKTAPRLEYVENLGRLRSVSGRTVYKRGPMNYFLDTFIMITNTELAAMLGTPIFNKIQDMSGLTLVSGAPDHEPDTPDYFPDPSFLGDETFFTFEGVIDSNYGIIDTTYSYLFPSNCNIRAGIHALCVYCDMVDLTVVGDTRVNLLRAVPIPSSAKFMDQVDLEFRHIHYLPVTKTELRNVEVYIKDESGADIQFEMGRVILTLHFRKRKVQEDQLEFYK